MERKDMIRRLDVGEKAIDLSIEKFGDILNGTGINDSSENCACCYVDDDNNCLACPIQGYEDEQFDLCSAEKKYDDAFECNLCGSLPNETDKEGIKKVIKYLNRVKQWMIEKGEY